MTTSLRSMTQPEYDAWLPRAMAHYVADIVGAGVPEDAAVAKSELDFPRLLPEGLATEGQSLYVVEDDGAPVGILWLAEREDDVGPNLFVYDVEIDEAQRGRGLGKAAMELAEDEARRRGIPRVTLNVFGGNDVARNLYRGLGYSEVAVYMMKPV